MRAEGFRLTAGTTLTSKGALAANPQFVSGSDPAEHDSWIFRDGKKTVSGPELVADLDRLVAACAHDRAAVLDALIEAGELEAAMADADCADAATAAHIADELASTLCTGDPGLAAGAAAILNRINV